MLEAINQKMQYADRIAKKEGKEITTLEDFKIWNYKNYDKAQGVMATTFHASQWLRRLWGLRARIKVDKTAIDKAAPKDPF